MLGQIFENLLEENREKGAFYTPKEVVQYMCKESTIQYLKNHFPEEAKVDEFIRNNQISAYFSIRDNAIALNQKIDAVKVCDPAIGSGAFPIGILHELFEAKKFIYPYLKTNAEFNPANVKKAIIQNSIYGVDIEKGAVDIAQLRFWLALVVDETEPEPLPNLDYKIMQGNSLLESFEGIDLSKVAHNNIQIIEPERDLFGNIKESQMEVTFTKSGLVEDIQNLIEEYFNIENHTRKNEIKWQIDKLVTQHILFNIELRESQLKRWITEAGDPDNLKNAARKKYDNWIKESEDFYRKKKTLLDLQKTDERPYFLWHLFFMDVFDPSTSGGGFDIMIGNPPYIKEYTNKTAFDGFRNTKYYQGKMDIWYGFACNSLDMIKQNTGILTFIATNNWTTNAGASIMRKKIVSDYQIINLLDFKNFKIFENAGIQTMIMLFKNNNSISNYSFDYRSLLNENPDINDIINLLYKRETKNNQIFEYQFKRKDFMDKQQLTFNSTEIELILYIIRNKGNIYFSDNEVGNGIHPHHDFVSKKMLNDLPNKYKNGDGIFALSKEEKENLNLSNDELKLIKPYYSTKNFTKYYANPINTEWLIYTGSEFKDPKKITPYPSIKKHLDKFCKVITSDNKPYGLHRARNEKLFKGEKIIAQRKCPNEPVFTYTNFDCYVSATFYVIKTKRINQKYLTALLNSKLIAFWLKYKGKMQGNNYQIDKEPLVNIPIIKIKSTSPFELLVDYILFLKNLTNLNLSEKVDNNHISLFFEDVLNMMVYELYFEEHMKENKIDVLQFVDFKDISQLETFEEKRAVIQKEYYKLKEKDNPIRNRILLAPVHSPNIIKRINESTH